MKDVLLGLLKQVGIYRPHRRFKRLKKQTRGMMHYDAYMRFYEEVLQFPDLDVVEVGGAGGAGSISLAWGLRDSGKSSRVLVVEKCRGGSRTAGGTYKANLDALMDRFGEFGVRDFVQVFPHSLTFENAHEAVAMLGTEQISALVHDADGRIDRDFLFFWPLLIDGGLIVVDDYDDCFQAKRMPDGSMRVYGKKALTVRLLDQFRDWGLFEKRGEIQGAVFGVKPPGADFSRFDRRFCEKLVEENAQECRQREAKLSSAQ